MTIGQLMSFYSVPRYPRARYRLRKKRKACSNSVTAPSALPVVQDVGCCGRVGCPWRCASAGGPFLQAAAGGGWGDHPGLHQVFLECSLRMRSTQPTCVPDHKTNPTRRTCISSDLHPGGSIPAGTLILLRAQLRTSHCVFAYARR